MTPPRPRPWPVARLAVGALAGAALGAWLGHAHGGAFVAPAPLDAARWNVLTPGRDEAVVDQRGRGTGVAGGALVLTPHVFSRADTVAQRDPRPVAEVRVRLAADSGPLSLRLREGPKLAHVRVTPDAWSPPNGAWRAHDGTLVVAIAGGVARIGGVAVAEVGAATVELSAESEPVRIERLTLTDAAGATIVDEDPAAAWADTAPIVPGAVVGALAGAGAALVGVGGLVGLALPLAVCLAPPEGWLALVERLLLVRSTPWDVARIALVLALLPLLAQVVAASGRALPPGDSRDRADLLPWVGVTLGAGIAASRDLTGAAWLLAPVGLVFLALPLLLARGARLDGVGLLLRDLPAHACVAVFGWGPGLLPALAWRLLVLVGGAGTLLRRAPRLAADAVFFGGIALLPAAELAARSTWLDIAWDADRLGGAADWRDPAPTWEGACGREARATLLFAGGSSTGGAYQFSGEPTAFFPAQLHARLCAAGASIRTLNNGDGGRDSFTLSRSIDTLLAAHHPRLVVAYLGVNDLLTQESTRTRAQREALEAERGAAVLGLESLGRHSRLLTGFGLLARPAVDLAAPVVPDVPIEDAEVNLRRIAAATHAAGAKLLLLPEHAAPETARLIAGYGKLQARLAAELPDVAFLDVGAALAPWEGEGLLLDRNHLSRQGGARVAEVLAPVVASLLGAPLPVAEPAPERTAAP